MKKVLIIGEKCLDKFIYGDVNRLSPEAPIPVFIPKKTTTNDGMAGNVLKNFNSIVSTDNFEVEGIFQNKEITKTRYVEDKSNYPFIRVDEGEHGVDRILLSPQILEKIQNADVVIVSDYNKGFLTEEDLIQIGKESKFSVIDTKKKISSEVIKVFNFIKLNKREFETNKDLAEQYPEKFIVTLGSQGAVYNGILYPSESPRETIDVSGAGDTFVASFVKKYMTTNDVEVSIMFANKMANKVVLSRGVSVP